MDENIQDIAAASQGAAAEPEPTTLNEAFAIINRANKEGAPVDVGSGAGAEDLGGTGEQPSAGGSDGFAPATGESPAGAGEPAGDESGAIGSGDPIDGGSADGIQTFDYNPARQQIIDGVNKRAIERTQKMFADQGIRLLTIEDLYMRDEKTGDVVFRDPDKKELRYFSGRKEAQDYIDTINKQRVQRFRAEVAKAQRELMKEVEPSMRLVDFGPTYDMMNDKVKEVFNALVEPYAVNQGGITVGYNVDLNQLAKQAEKIAKMIPDKQPEPAAAANQQAPAKTPPMDIKTGAGKADDETEPTTLGEAMKMYNKQQREKKGK